MGDVEVFSAEKFSTNRGKSGKSSLLAKADRLTLARLGTREKSLSDFHTMFYIH